jgi:hypothetical protein
MIGLLVYLLIICIVCALAWWVVTQLPLPAPIQKIATVVIVVIFVIAVIYLLLPLAGTGPGLHRYGTVLSATGSFYG